MDPNMDYRFTLKEELKHLILQLSYMVDPLSDLDQATATATTGTAATGKGTSLAFLLSSHCGLLHGLIKERDRASGLSMIVNDTSQLNNPDNACIVQEGIAVQRQYTRLAVQLMALDGPTMVVEEEEEEEEEETEQKKTSGEPRQPRRTREWGDSSGEEEEFEATLSVTEVVQRTLEQKKKIKQKKKKKKKKTAQPQPRHGWGNATTLSFQKQCEARALDLLTLLGNSNGNNNGGKEEKSDGSTTFMKR